MYVLTLHNFEVWYSAWLKLLKRIACWLLKLELMLKIYGTLQSNHFPKDVQILKEFLTYNKI